MVVCKCCFDIRRAAAKMNECCFDNGVATFLFLSLSPVFCVCLRVLLFCVCESASTQRVVSLRLHARLNLLLTCCLHVGPSFVIVYCVCFSDWRVFMYGHD